MSYLSSHPSDISLTMDFRWNMYKQLILQTFLVSSPTTTLDPCSTISGIPLFLIFISCSLLRITVVISSLMSGAIGRHVLLPFFSQ